jgi:TolA-binding protein
MARAQSKLFVAILVVMAILSGTVSEASAQFFLNSRARRHYEECAELYKNRQFDEARGCIDDFLSIYPNSRWEERLRFMDAKMESDISKAQSKMRDFAREYPDGPYSDDAYFCLGQLFQLTGDYEQAYEYYSRVYERFAVSELWHDSIMNAAKCLMLNGEAESAVLDLEAYMAAVSDERPEPSIRALLADALFEAGRYERAQQEYREIISRAESPQAVSPEVYLKVAGIYEAAGNHDASLQTYRRFMSIFPDSPMRPFVGRKMSSLADGLGVDLSINGRPHILEAGAFESRQQAMVFLGRLKRMGFQAYLVTRSSDTKDIYSVRLGPYESMDSAAAAAERLDRETGIIAAPMPQGGPLQNGRSLD